MALQLGLFAVVAIVSLLYEYARRTVKNRKIFIAVLALILALFAGFRTWWLGDLIKYYTSYRDCQKYTLAELFNGGRNFGLRFLFRGAGMLGISYDILIFAISTFFSICLAIVIYKYSSNVFWSYFMFIAMGFYIFTYSGLKQTVAMGFCLLAFTQIEEEKIWKFLLLTFLGGCFHAPAFIFFIAYPFARKKIDRWYYIFIVVIVLTVFVLRGQIASLLGDAYYSDEEKFSSGSGVGGRFLMMALIMGISFYLRPLKQGDRLYVLQFNIMILALIFQTFSIFSNNFTRLTDYFFQFIVIFFPLMMEPGEKQALYMPERSDVITYRSKTIYIFLSLGVIAFGIWYYISYLQGSEWFLKSFKFFWEIDPYALYG